LINAAHNAFIESDMSDSMNALCAALIKKTSLTSFLKGINRRSKD